MLIFSAAVLVLLEVTTAALGKCLGFVTSFTEVLLSELTVEGVSLVGVTSIGLLVAIGFEVVVC